MELDDKKELRKWGRLGFVIGLIALCVSICVIGILGVFICFMEFRWGLLALCVIAFSCGVGAGYMLINYYYALIEKKELEDKERRTQLEAELDKKYKSKFSELEDTIKRESRYIQRMVEMIRYGCYK